MKQFIKYPEHCERERRAEVVGSYQHEHAAETREDRGRKEEVETSLQVKLKKLIVKNQGLNLFKINLAIWIKLCMHACNFFGQPVFIFLAQGFVK